MWGAMLAVLCVGLAVGLMFGSAIDDAEAKKKKKHRPPAVLTTLWATIEDDGSTTSSKGATASRKDSLGIYEIDFYRDISKCAHTATVAGGTSGDISTFAQGPQTVKVLTLNDTGTAYEDTPFHLVVNC
jgi:hypothetical protein